MTIYCCQCATETQCRLTGGPEVYPHRKDLADKRFWRCRECRNYIGCHPGTERPLGSIPTPALRTVRMRIHGVIDPLWKSKRASRGKIYAEMSALLGYPFHTSEINNEAEGRRALEAARQVAARVTLSSP